MDFINSTPCVKAKEIPQFTQFIANRTIIRGSCLSVSAINTDIIPSFACWNWAGNGLLITGL